MKKDKGFKKVTTVERITNKKRTVSVSIDKFIKNGTSRIFFTPTYDGKRITKVMFARKYDAVSLARKFIAWKAKNAIA